jgi:hypothetical protein
MDPVETVCWSLTHTSLNLGKRRLSTIPSRSTNTRNVLDILSQITYIAASLSQFLHLSLRLRPRPIRLPNPPALVHLPPLVCLIQ